MFRRSAHPFSCDLLLILLMVSGVLQTLEVEAQTPRQSSRPESTPLRPADQLIRQQEPARISPRVLDLVTGANIQIVISLSKQRAWMKAGYEVAIDTPVSTGKRARMTPTGTFKVTQKEADHRSSIYGNFVDANGNIVRTGISTKIDSAPSGTRYVGAPMKYFLRLTDYGVGMHAGHLPGYPASHGCIRMPEEVAARFFEKAKIGTVVRIVD